MVSPQQAAAAGEFANLRVGFGLAVRELQPGVPLVLAGAAVDYPDGLASGVDDGDVICLAVLEAILSACGMPDVGTLFPAEEAELRAPGSLLLLSQAISGLFGQQLAGIINLSVQVATRADGLNEDRQRMRTLLAEALDIDPARITLNLSREPLFSAVEAGGSLAAFANVLVMLREPEAPKKKKKAAKTTAPLDLEDAGKAEPTAAAEDISHLPERAQKFERAIQSNLPPLPQADPPQPGASLIIYTDGACRGNPGPASTGWVILNEFGALVAEGGSKLGEQTNNQAEYLAVKEVAEYIEKNIGREFKLEFRMDSKLVACQLSGTWKIKDYELKQLAMQVMNQLMYFESYELKHVPREENKRADALANKALGVK